MDTFSFKRVFLLLSVLVVLAVVNSSPTCVGSHDWYTGTDPSAAQAPLSLFKPNANNAVPSPPYFVAYADQWIPGETGPPPVADIAVGILIVVDHFILITF